MSRRPLSVTVAAILLALFSVLFDLSFPLWAVLIPREDKVPAVVVYTSVVVGMVALVGTTGLWMLRKWASG